jgi:hypothetical protein
MKWIIAGSRSLSSRETVYHECNRHIILDATEVVSGTARGADRIGEQWAEENNIPVRRFPADWNEYGKAAGMIRNAQMAEYADGLIAFWNGQSRGTKNMIDIATDKGLKVIVIPVY